MKRTDARSAVRLGQTSQLPLSVLVMGALAASLFAIGCAKLPDDGAKTVTKHVENMNRVRYIEIFVVGGNAITGKMQANCYNTTFANYDQASKDSASPAYVAGIDLEAIKKQFRALGAFMNGPKLWMLDWVDIPLGAEQDINGRKVPWCAELLASKSDLEAMGKVSYKPTTIARKSKIGYNKGTQVFLIDDAEGNTWIMKGFELGLKPRWTFEEYAKDPASLYKQLPAGWKFRTKVLDKDLTLVPATGVATIMPDEFFNVYDKTGPGYSDYKP